MDKQSTLIQYLIDAFDLSEFPPAEQDEVVRQLSDVITQAVLIRAIPQLSDEDGAKYDEMLVDNIPIVDVMTFLQSKVPNITDIITDEIGRLQERLANPESDDASTSSQIPA